MQRNVRVAYAIAAFDAADASPTPRAFFAVTVQVYDLPTVSPVTVIGAAVAPRCVADFVTPPLLDVQVAVVLWIGEPLFTPIVKVTLI